MIIYDEQAEFTKEHFRYIREKLGLKMEKDALGTAAFVGIRNKMEEAKEAYNKSLNQADCCSSSPAQESILQQLIRMRSDLRARLSLVEETIANLPERYDDELRIRKNLRALGFYIP